MNQHSFDSPNKKINYSSPHPSIPYNTNRDQWKIASSNHLEGTASLSPSKNKQHHHTLSPSSSSCNQLQNQPVPSPVHSLGRSQSPFSRLDRYKSKSPIINVERERHLTPHPIIKEEITPIHNEHINESLKLVNDRKSLKLEEQLSKKKLTRPTITKDYVPWTWWSGTAFLLTCCIPNWVLSTCGNKKTKLVQQAWREKITLCTIIILFCAGLGFITFGMKIALCSHERVTNTYSYYNTTTKQTTLTWRSDISVYGTLYPFDVMSDFLNSGYNISLTKDFEGANLSPLFDADLKGVCSQYELSFNATPTICTVANPYTLEPTASIQLPCIPLYKLTQYHNADNFLEFNWHDLQLNLDRSNLTPTIGDPHLLVLSDTVIDIMPYILQNKKLFGDNVDLLLRQTAGQDATYIFSAWQDAKDAWPCIAARYSTGVISSDTMGCIVYEIVTDFFLACVIVLILIRYSMALGFHWLVSPRLTLPGGRSRGILAWRSIAGGNQFPKQHRPSNSSSLDTLVASNNTNESYKPVLKLIENDPRYTILFVTCYSEGEDSIKNTLDSLVETTYSDRHKLLFIVADGIITGSGNTKPTSDICRDLLTLEDCGKDEEEPRCEYEAIADGYKRINQAQVYIGHYRSVPALLVVKCGTESERALPNNNKPGNRGKRDSQMILMTFFQKVIFYDSFSQLEYEIFWKMRKVMKGGLTPDKFELVLMVDADTRVASDSISYMVAAMNNDITLMGLCGETKVANKTESWVTAIQVFEYFISHHYAKAFESMFGGVTCLPGCFSMYRIKAPKNGGWIPILASPDIIQEFNATIVNTLHAKNLLLLGEDRFLSTLMLRVFPRRQMIFVPQAKCRTVVPSSFKVLLSQRRRWINSTIHNLMELALVSDLCGIACLSMQFVVVIDLFSSIVLPAALILLVYFFVNFGLTDTPQYQPLFILLATLGLPALLILLTAKKVSYIGWMTIYLLALPVWNFILPIYSFWHFDDFSWGETRKVNGGDLNCNKSRLIEEEANKRFLLDGEAFDVQRKLWHIWEKERRLAPKQEKAKREYKFGDDSELTANQPVPRQVRKQHVLPSPPAPTHHLHLAHFYSENNDRVYYPQPPTFRQTPPTLMPPQFIHQQHQQMSPSSIQQHIHHSNTNISPHAFYQLQQQQQLLDRQHQYIIQSRQHHRTNKYYNNRNNQQFYG